MKQFLLSLFFILLTGTLYAQYFQTGQDPASVRWRQINTENFQLIYPDYYEAKAQKIAQTLEVVYKSGGKTLNHSPKKNIGNPSYTNGQIKWSCGICS